MWVGFKMASILKDFSTYLYVKLRAHFFNAHFSKAPRAALFLKIQKRIFKNMRPSANFSSAVVSARAGVMRATSAKMEITSGFAVGVSEV